MQLRSPLLSGKKQKAAKQENSWGGPFWRIWAVPSRTAGEVRLEGFGPLSRQNGPPERAMSRAKQMGSRKAGEVRFEGFGPLSGPNGAPERERSTEAHGERSTKTKRTAGEARFEGFRAAQSPTRPTRKSKQHSQADQEWKSGGSPF